MRRISTTMHRPASRRRERRPTKPTKWQKRSAGQARSGRRCRHCQCLTEPRASSRHSSRCATRIGTATAEAGRFPRHSIPSSATGSRSRNSNAPRWRSISAIWACAVAPVRITSALSRKPSGNALRGTGTPRTCRSTRSWDRVSVSSRKTTQRSFSLASRITIATDRMARTRLSDAALFSVAHPDSDAGTNSRPRAAITNSGDYRS